MSVCSLNGFKLNISTSQASVSMFYLKNIFGGAINKNTLSHLLNWEDAVTRCIQRILY